MTKRILRSAFILVLAVFSLVPLCALADTQNAQVGIPYTAANGDSGFKFESVDLNPSMAMAASPSPGDLIGREYSGGAGLSYTSLYYKSHSLVTARFVKYLTASWATSDHYVWTETNTVSYVLNDTITANLAQQVIRALGLSISRTTSYSVAIYIPADASRLSKLYFASDFTQVYYDKYYTYLTNPESYLGEGSLLAPEEDTYLLVEYKS